MKRLLVNIKDIIVNNKVISIILGVLLLGILFLVIFNRSSVDHIKFVNKVLGNKYYKIECMSDSCDYIIAYKGEILGKSKMAIYNAKGKKVASYKRDYGMDAGAVQNVYAVNKNYIIFQNVPILKNETSRYTIATNKGKEKYSSDNALVSLNNYLISEKLEESYNILDRNGKTLYTNVKDIKTYADGKYLTANIKKEDIILDETGKAILNGYKIVKQVKNEDDKTIYLVLQDISKSVYYYFNTTTNKIKGDSFNSYIEGSKTGELVVSKKVNNDLVKYLLNKDGKQTKIKEVSLDDLKVIDRNKYEVVEDSYIINNQSSVLVRSLVDNSFGTYNIKSNKYTKLFNFKDDNKGVSLSKLLSNESELYLQIVCNNSNCEENTLVVYDMVNDKKLYNTTNKDYSIRYFTNYEDYNVVRYSSDSSDDYKNKYAVYDKDNKEVYRSTEQIVIIDKDYNFGKEAYSYSLVLFSAKKNKALNDTDNLANKVSIGKSYFYKYSKDNKTYLYNSKGDKLKTINSDNVSLIYSNDTIMYVNNSKVSIVNPTDNKTRVYRLKLNERINAADGEIMAPYKNTLFVNNTISNYGKVINSNGRTIKKIRRSIIESVNYNKDTNNVIIITKKTKKNNNYYGMYIGR